MTEQLKAAREVIALARKDAERIRAGATSMAPVRNVADNLDLLADLAERALSLPEARPGTEHGPDSENRQWGCVCPKCEPTLSRPEARPGEVVEEAARRIVDCDKLRGTGAYFEAVERDALVVARYVLSLPEARPGEVEEIVLDDPQSFVPVEPQNAFANARTWALEVLDGKPESGTVETFVDLAMLRILADAFETVEGARSAGVFSGTLANGDTFGDEDE